MWLETKPPTPTTNNALSLTLTFLVPSLFTLFVHPVLYLGFEEFGGEFFCISNLFPLFFFFSPLFLKISSEAEKMEQRLANTWRMTNNEKKFIESVLASDLRVDGRRPFDYRDLTIKFGREQGLSEVQLGQTRVMSYVTSQLVQPYPDRPNEGTLSIFTEFSPMADPSFEAGRPGEFAVELGRVIDRGLRESRAMDMESLCVVVGKSVWSIRVDLHIVDNGGNLIDAANIAALAALLTFRRPDCTLGGDDGQELIMHDAEVREPLPLIIHHLPIAVTFAVFGEGNIMVIDPTHKEEMVMGGRMTFTMNSNGDICAVQKAGGVGVMSSIIMQCLQIASAKAADITSKIKHAVEIYNTERASQKANHYLVEVANQVSLSDVIMKEKQVENLIEHLAYMPLDELENSNQGDALAVDTRTKHESISQGRYTDAFVRGPANWDPYSRGISSHLVTSFPTLPGPSTKVKEHNVVTSNEMTVEYSVEHTTGASSSSTRVLGAPAVRQHSKGPKSLKDAVKLRTRRKSGN